MINFHIGVPGVIESVSELFWDANIRGRRTHADLPTRESFSENLLPYLICGRKDAEEVGILRRRALDYVSKWPRSEPIALSEPLLLGGASQLMRAGPCFPDSGLILSRLSSLFMDWDLRLHLLITNQFDAIWMQLHVPVEQRIRAIRFCNFSWANLVWRVKRFSPESKIVVWDAEEPATIRENLQKEIFSANLMVNSAQSTLRLGGGRGEDLVAFKYFDENDYQNIALLDIRYEEDLFKIASLSRVTLYSGTGPVSA